MAGSGTISDGVRLEKIGFIFQTHNLLPFLDATDTSTALPPCGDDLWRASVRQPRAVAALGMLAQSDARRRPRPQG